MLLVVEEAEVLEATREGKEILTPEDTPVHCDFTATADKVPLSQITLHHSLSAGGFPQGAQALYLT